ncbi:MAG TPA: hypothetical protein VIH18_36290 [Candidatus Binatia bacterium]|jgi:hypothetical protein
MPAQRFKELLASNRMMYVIHTHPIASTAQEIASSAQVAGKKQAKTAKIDDKMAMAVLPTSYKESFAFLKRATVPSLP